MRAASAAPSAGARERSAGGEETGSEATDGARPSGADAGTVEAVARGGALNLIGNAVYGSANFILLAIVTTQLGIDDAGVLLVAIALFNILAKVCEFGAATGLIRTISRDRAIGHLYECRANMRVAVGLSLVGGTVAATAMYLAAPQLAQLFAQGEDVDAVTDVVRGLAPFLAFASIYSVLVQGTRGFDTMVPQVTIEKIGKALLQPIAVLIVLLAGSGVMGAAYAWAGVQFLALFPAAFVFHRLLRRAEAAADRPPRRVSRELASAFLAYSLPRALGQVFQVAVLWMDTLVIAAILGTTEAGIYAAGTRYLLIGLFTAEAIMQVIGPRISGLLARRRTEEARHLYATGTAWQTSLTWTVYLVVIFFSTPLLRVFGDEYVAAGPALVWLAFAMLAASLFGPSDTVILMSGRSRLSLFNALVAVSLNLAGNFLLVPTYGITAAGAVWAVTLVVAAALPAFQAARRLQVHPWSPALRSAVLCSVIGVGLPVVASWLVFGPTVLGLVVAVAAGGIGQIAALHRFGADVALDTLFRSLLPSRRPRLRADQVGGAGIVS
jgi:O-antigen/teichoic acid export membrane protein